MKKILAFAFVFACLGLFGCDDGPAVAPVTGTITHDGEPLVGAMIEFQPDRGAPSYAESVEGGHYEVKYQTDRIGALLGHHYVNVTMAGEKTDPETDTTYNVPETVPRKYNDPTELEFEVKKGKNVFDIKIEGKRERRRRKRN